MDEKNNNAQIDGEHKEINQRIRKYLNFCHNICPRTNNKGKVSRERTSNTMTPTDGNNKMCQRLVRQSAQVLHTFTLTGSVDVQISPQCGHAPAEFILLKVATAYQNETPGIGMRIAKKIGK